MNFAADRSTLRDFDHAVAPSEGGDEVTTPSWSWASTANTIKNQLPRLEIVNVLRQYTADGGGTEKLTGDLSAGLVVAGTLIEELSMLSL